MIDKLEELYNRLKIKNKESFFYFNEIDALTSESISVRYKNALKEMQPEAVFCLENEPFILFFNLKNKNNSSEKIESIHKQSWNFDKAPIIVISTSSDIVFYNAFDFNNKTSKLSKLTDSEEDFEDFSYENIYSGSLFNKYPNAFKDTNRVNKQLLEHITSYRDKLVSEEKLDTMLASNLLSRTIFLRYLQDREIKIDNTKNLNFSAYFKDKVELYKLFDFLKKEFNGDLFDISDKEINLINDDHIDLLKRFFENTDASGQMRLLPFDFSIIPIELISNIYENFLNPKKQKNGAYYTPTFLVDYIINKTVSPFLKKKKDSSCKVLDPACGSGIFLIETLRKVIQKEEFSNSNSKLSIKRLKELVEENIFGIDKDEEAINIAIFSLYITLLDYQEPRSILKFKFPKLKGTNFFTSDFFDEENSFNSILKEKNLNLILSNPPYGSIKEGNHISWCKQNNIPISDNQIAQSFLARASDFCSKNTKVSMIVTSKILYNLNAKSFRTYLLEQFKINEIFELSAVRKQIFNGAIPPVSVITYESSSTNNLNNKFKHIAIKPNLFFKHFKTLIIEKNDEKIVEQSYVYKYDWLWKVLLYGNILDFYFIKRLKDNYPTINQHEDVYCGQGIIQNSGSYDSTHLIGYPFLNTQKKEFQSFFIEQNNAIFNKKNVHRVRDKELFKAPATLVKRGLMPNLACVSAFSNRTIVFTDSIFAIKSKCNNIILLKSIAGMLNSELVNYLVLNLTVSAGVEREEIKEKEFLSFPFVIDPSLASIVDSLQQEKNEADLISLNKIINKKFTLDETEKDLIDYSLNISIPIWKFGDTLNKINKPVALSLVNEKQLVDYVEIFQDSFAEEYKYFNVDIYTFKNCTLVNFKARENKVNNPSVQFINDQEMEDIIKQITPLSIDKISNEIFVKKDIKGFQEDSFFVIKTNEYKNWHKAIARLDVNEFSNAIWEAEIELSK